MKLEDRIVLITGAARRVGRAIALRLARERCRLALHYFRSAAEASVTAGDCIAAGAPAAETFAADLASPSGASELAADVLQRMGRVDVLVNNASLFSRDALESFDPDQWERTLRVNVTAPAALAHALRDSLRRGGGCIVNLCDSGARRCWPDYLSYVVSKGALETLTGALARSLAPQVRVVGVAPGVVEWPEDYDDVTRQRLVRSIPLGRAGSPEDVASAVAYLLRDADYVSGAILDVDGGRGRV